MSKVQRALRELGGRSNISICRKLFSCRVAICWSHGQHSNSSSGGLLQLWLSLSLPAGLHWRCTFKCKQQQPTQTLFPLSPSLFSLSDVVSPHLIRFGSLGDAQMEYTVTPAPATWWDGPSLLPLPIDAPIAHFCRLASFYRRNYTFFSSSFWPCE